MWPEVDSLFHVVALVGPEVASVFGACTTVLVPGFDPEVVHGINL